MTIIVILPISGGGFVSQVAALQLLRKSSGSIKIMMGTSGGNLAACIAAGASFQPDAMEMITSRINSDIFVTPWSSVSSASNITAYFKGNIYNSGRGKDEFMTSCFTEETITKYEIYTGTYNRLLQKTQICCNRKIEDSHLSLNNEQCSMTQSLPVIYCNGDLQLLASMFAASACIPTLVPPQVIDDQEYVDGGISSASPITQFYESIIDLYHSSTDSMHIIYVSCVDLEENDSGTCQGCNNILDNWKLTTNGMIRSQMINDRLMTIRLVRDMLKRSPSRSNYGKVTLDHLDTSIITMTEIYPTIYRSVNIESFRGEDAVMKIREAKNNLRMRVWK